MRLTAVGIDCEIGIDHGSFLEFRSPDQAVVTTDTLYMPSRQLAHHQAGFIGTS